MSDDNKPFPVQGGYACKHKPSTIPWWLAEEVYKVYVSKYGDSQSLECLARRGGFGRKEILMLLKEG